MEQALRVSSLYDIRKSTKAGILPPSLIGVGTVLPTELQQYVMRFTPQDAARILEHVHPKQRKVNPERVRTLFRAMQNGKFHEPPFTFDSIAFDTEGYLVNGRHRLTALSQFSAPLSFIVVVGVNSPDSLPLPEGDGGLPRSKWFIAGLDRNEWSVVNYLAEHIYGGNPARTDVEQLFPLFAESLDAIRRTTQYSPAAPIRAAFVFCWAETNDAVYRQDIREQWIAYCKMDVASMWPSTARLYKKMQEYSRAGSTERHNQFASAIYAIKNPEAIKIRQQVDAPQLVKTFVSR